MQIVLLGLAQLPPAPAGRCGDLRCCGFAFEAATKLPQKSIHDNVRPLHSFASRRRARWPIPIPRIYLDFTAAAANTN